MELIEVDAVNLVRKVGGTDQLAAIRTAIGL
ncbi:phage major tail tube protein [Lamprobacter modestohalophilus]|nr:phage major tail tube protein [Lamprobacter modestohalophilus]MEA1053428.1 phage major tail tube protein [Lamprobacter modestohalophilus]